ncbi:MAG TPA: nitronate monooxygenase [Aquabacterium sp.]|uniref:NAD(P)H-dependent flavin oxidoreductase n=1 Tax=Aquabacterium sp. TaxID=1872578 RepID=UPI002E2F2783|nr:nitronate monooxygenase [Aquabacterium sp.]HEX5372630.1 nitronate monooxygenase [Aquabacterium sp.]
MNTRLTRLLGIQHPIVLPGMTYVAVPQLVGAVSQAGGLGILASGGLSPEECRASIAQVRALTDKPFAVGCSLLLPGATECAEVALQERVPVINISMGKGDWVIERAHAYGGKVIATVSNEKHARSAIDMGVDGLIVTGHEAAAHGGNVTSLVLVPVVRDLCDLPIIAAGGFADGRGLVAALALGADAVAMGTRFATSRESPVHADTKQLIIDKPAEDTIYSKNFDTFPCRVMRTPGGRKYTARRLSPPVALSRSIQAALEMDRPLTDLARDAMSQGAVNAVKIAYFGAATLAMRKAIHEGNHEEGVQLIGQSQGLIHDVPSVAEIVQRVLAEASAVIGALPRD